MIVQCLKTTFQRKKAPFLSFYYDVYLSYVMQMKLLFFFFLLTFGVFIQAQGNSQAIRGAVIDKHSQFPLAGARASVVILTHNYLGITTDVDGNFKLENIPIC